MPTVNRKRGDSGQDLPAASNSGPVPKVPSYLQIHECSDELVLAMAHDVLLAVWRSPMTVERIRRIVAFTKQARETQKRFHVLSVVEPAIVAPPDSATRAAASQLSSTFEDCCAGVAMVMEGTGIKHVVLRMAVATINLLAKQSVEQTVFDTVPAACRWLGQRGTKLDEHELVGLIAALRAQPPREH